MGLDTKELLFSKGIGLKKDLVILELWPEGKGNTGHVEAGFQDSKYKGLEAWGGLVCSEKSKEASVLGEKWARGRVVRNVITWSKALWSGAWSHGQNPGFYAEWDGKSLESYELGSFMSDLRFWKNHLGCCVEKRLQGMRVEEKIPGRRILWLSRQEKMGIWIRLAWQKRWWQLVVKFRF